MLELNVHGPFRRRVLYSQEKMDHKVDQKSPNEAGVDVFFNKTTRNWP